MTELQIFKNSEFGEIRTVTIDNEPWFCLADVCKALDLEQVSRVKSRLKEDGVTTSKVIDRLGREQEATFINESNLYKTIFQSRKESAERFTEWVTSEVLPSIRRTGQYQIPNLSKEMQAIVLLDSRTVKMEQRIDKLEFDIPLYGSEADELSNHVKRKGVVVLEGKSSEAYKDSNIRSKVYRDIYDQIKREFGIYSEDGKPKSYKALKRRYIDRARALIERYEAPQYLQELIQDANTQLSLSM